MVILLMNDDEAKISTETSQSVGQDLGLQE
jgi:hypothetical protein